MRLGVHGSAAVAEQVVAAAGHDPATVELVPYDVSDPFRPLRAGAVHAMIVKFDPREPDIATSRPVAHDGRVVIVAADHPLAGRDTVSVEELVPYPAFARPGVFPGHIWDQVVPPYTPSGVPIRRIHRMTTVEAMVDILATTRSVHLSFQSLEAVLPSHVRAVPVHDLPAAPVRVAWLRDAHLPAHVESFVSELERGVSS